MAAAEYHVGQRLSLKDQLLTVRYIGPVADKAGTWLGVEWDDPGRGKHDGTHQNVKYFECRSGSPKAASFLKPNQAWDPSVSFLQALREKYMPADSATPKETVYFSSKQAEEVGFEKFARRQAQLQGIHVLVLDRMRISLMNLRDDASAIREICANITDLDLGSNLVECLNDVLILCKYLPKLRRLTLDGNRFSVASTSASFRDVDYLSLSDTVLTWENIVLATAPFPSLTQLAACNNELSTLSLVDNGLVSLRQLDLSGNAFSCLPSSEALAQFPHLDAVTLKHNCISQIHEAKDSSQAPILDSLKSFDLAYNAISEWNLLDRLPSTFSGLKHLRLTGNPIYSGLKSADGRALTADDGYMLTIARLPSLETLNYSKITEKERLNAETYYLGQIGLELSLSPPDKEGIVLTRHPRWTTLCEEYGEPKIHRAIKQDEVDPNSLASRLVKLSFSSSFVTSPVSISRSWTEEVPKSFNIYAVLGIVGKRLSIMPLKLRLVWETGERDPVGRHDGQAEPDWWDSDDEDSGGDASSGEFVAREVELVPGTMPLGAYIEGREATIRVEMRSG